MRMGIQEVYGCSALYSHLGKLNTCSYLQTKESITLHCLPVTGVQSINMIDPAILATLQEMLSLIFDVSFTVS